MVPNRLEDEKSVFMFYFNGMHGDSVCLICVNKQWTKFEIHVYRTLSALNRLCSGCGSSCKNIFVYRTWTHSTWNMVLATVWMCSEWPKKLKIVSSKKMRISHLKLSWFVVGVFLFEKSNCFAVTQFKVIVWLIGLFICSFEVKWKRK